MMHYIHVIHSPQWIMNPCDSYWRHYAMSEERLEKVFQNTETEVFCICRFLR